MSTMQIAPMNGGDGVYSYSRNSYLQREALDAASIMVNEAIANKLDLRQLLSQSKTVRIADLGCSVGPNTFFIVQAIVSAVKLKCQTDGIDSNFLEFQAFLNDQASNDFNMLFKSIPEKDFHLAAVPGSFYGRLFPKSSLHFVHSSYALQWISKVPEELLDRSSPAWNKGRIYITNAPKDVVEAYRRQFAKDMTTFLNARAEEVVPGGLMALLVPGVGPYDECTFNATIAIFESVFRNLVSMGLFEEEKLDTFNLPIYGPPLPELEFMIKTNGHFCIEISEPLNRPKTKTMNVDAVAMHFRAGWEGIFKAHFGSELTDELFEGFKKKLAESDILSINNKTAVESFVLLKRKLKVIKCGIHPLQQQRPHASKKFFQSGSSAPKDISSIFHELAYQKLDYHFPSSGDNEKREDYHEFPKDGRTCVVMLDMNVINYLELHPYVRGRGYL